MRRPAYIVGVLLEKRSLAHLGARELAADGRDSVESCRKPSVKLGSEPLAMKDHHKTYHPFWLFLLRTSLG